jgi:molybdate transport system substrate-binding protein
VANIGIRLLAAVLPLLAGLSAGASAAAEIKVLCGGGMRAVLQQLAPAFEKSSGHKLVIEYATAGKIEEKVAADETIDVAILTKPPSTSWCAAPSWSAAALPCWRACPSAWR